VALYLELVDAATENVLFKADYDRPLANLVTLQNEIARDVSNRLRAKLTSSEKAQIEKSGTQNAEAYQLYLKGRFHWNKRKPDEHRKAIQNFEQAIALDPNYALAYAGLADVYAVDSSPVEGQEAIDKLRAAARRAMELDPTLGPPHAAYATSYQPSYDWAASEKEHLRAIELDPSYPTAHQWYAEMLSRLGRHYEAIAEIDRARELDPLSLVINSDRAYILINARRYDDAIEQAKRTLDMDPRWGTARGWLAYGYELKGMFEEAIGEVEKRLKVRRNSSRGKRKSTKRLGRTKRRPSPIGTDWILA
jgi:tetratricopeptide (TPR) repeat protein